MEAKLERTSDVLRYRKIFNAYMEGAPETDDKDRQTLAVQAKEFASAERPLSDIVDEVIGVEKEQHPIEATLALFNTILSRTDCNLTQLLRLYMEANLWDPYEYFSGIWHVSEEQEKKGTASIFDRALKRATFLEWVESLRYVIAREGKDNEWGYNDKLHELLLREVGCLGPKTKRLAHTLAQVLGDIGSDGLGPYSQEDWEVLVEALIVTHESE